MITQPNTNCSQCPRLYSYRLKNAENHIDWHKLKGKKINRSAELISAALCQLLISENEKDAINYLEESIKWLKGINVDKPCPSKNSSF